MSTPTAQCLKRLQIELRKLSLEPDAAYQVGADPQNMLRCYFIVDGPEGTPYVGGRYVGLLEIPSDYPFKPPSVQMCTPSGRFRTGMPICLSNSSYHPESWSPMWGLRTILIALVSFFVSNEATSGSIEGTEEERRLFAVNSRRYNVERLRTVYKRVFPAAYDADVAYLEGKENGSATPVGSDEDDNNGRDHDKDNCGGSQQPSSGSDQARSSAGGAGVSPQSGSENASAGTDRRAGQKPASDQMDAAAAAAAALTPNGGAAQGTVPPMPLPGDGRPLPPPSLAKRGGKELDQVASGQMAGVPLRRWMSLVVLLAVGIAILKEMW